MKIIDEVLLFAFRLKGRCEWCGKYGGVDPHHIFARGLGGGHRLDIEINLIALCRLCHNEVHAGHIMRVDLLAIVAKREKMSQDEILDAIRDLKRRPRL